MAKYQLNPTTGIENISGAISRHRLPDGSVEAWVMTKKGRMYHRIYRRSTPPSVNESAARVLFSKASAEVKRRKAAGDPRPRPAIFKEIYALLKQQLTGTETEAKRRQNGGKC